MLNCGHTFCQECLHGYYKTYQQQRRAQAGKLPCPTCRELTALPSNGVAGLRNDFKVAKIEEMFKTINIRKERAKADGKICDVCRAEKRTTPCKFSCDVCNMNFCKDCIKKHSKNPVFKNHKVTSKGTGSVENASCKVHKNEAGRFFCRTCQVLLCTVCIMNEHEGHNVTEVESMFNQHQEDVRNLRNVVASKMEELEKKSVELESLRNLNIQSCQQAEINIKQRTRALMTEIKKQEDMLLETLREKRNTKLDKISKEVDAIRFAMSKATGLQDYAEMTSHRNSVKFLAIHDELVQRMRTIAEVDTYVDSSVLAAVVFVPGKTEPSLGKIDEIRGPVKEISKNPMLVCPPPPNPQQRPSTPASSASGQGQQGQRQNTPPQAAPSPSRSVSLFYTNGDASPPKKLLSIENYGSQHGELRDPLGVTCLLNGDIAVAEWGNKRIQLFSSLGNTIRTFGSGNIGPQGISVTLRGNIIVSDATQKRLQVFTPSGNTIAKWGLGKFYAPCGVAISPNGNCIITDVAEHTLSLYQGERKCITRIGSRGSRDDQFNNPLYCTTGLHNQIIISDSDNHCIKIFDSRGRFIRKFGSEGSEDGKLKYPRGVATDPDGNILVADRNNDRVSLFSSQGHFIRQVLPPGCVKDPYGVAVSITRNLVVTESSAGRAALKIFEMN